MWASGFRRSILRLQPTSSRGIPLSQKQIEGAKIALLGAIALFQLVGLTRNESGGPVDAYIVGADSGITLDTNIRGINLPSNQDALPVCMSHGSGAASDPISCDNEVGMPNPMPICIDHGRFIACDDRIDVGTVGGN